MKILVVYNKQGQLIFTQTNATENYKLTVQNILDGNEVIGVDLSTGKLVTVNSDISNYNKRQKINELAEKNRVYLLEQNLAIAQAENKELNKEIKENIKRLETANAEIGEIIFANEE